MSEIREEANLASSIADTLTHTDEWITGILDTLQWTKEYIMEESDVKVQCSNDPNHQIPQKVAEKHEQFCQLKKLGYSKSDLEEERKKSSKFFYENSNTVISLDLDDETIKNILSHVGRPRTITDSDLLPQTMSHINELSREQRLMLYQYCIDTAVAAEKPTTVPIEDLQFPTDDKTKGDGRTKTAMELKAEERDMKRRRQSYRSKNVHTGKKSYKEVIREVIEMQTTLLRERLVAEKETKSSEKRISLPEESGQSKKKNHKHKPSEKCSASPEDSGQESDKSTKIRKRKHSSDSATSEDDSDDKKIRKKHKHKKHKKHKHHKSNKK